jgi:folate-binding protein YgfZ
MQLDFEVAHSSWQALQSGTIFVPADAGLFQVTGPGALDCLQGLLTNDVVAAGENSLSYGGMLTSKGMIVLDPFVLRADGITLMLPASARETALAHFTRVLPPRLARVHQRTGEWSALFLLGGRSEADLQRALGAGLLPRAGQAIRASDDVMVARATPAMPFDWLVIGGVGPVQALAEALRGAGAIQGDQAVLALARVLAGWPALGAEIDEKTLPQEVRYDELGAVSYSKGCYTGQETVARVHFRGHVNRALRGAILPSQPIGEDRKLSMEGRDVGVLRTTVTTGGQTLGLAMVRREIAPDAVLGSAQGVVRLVPLPVNEGVPA